MKKIIFLLLAAAPLTLMAQSGRYTVKTQQPPQAFSITGQVVDVQNGMAILSYVNAEGTHVIDRIKFERGGFQFSGNIPGLALAYLTISADKRSYQNIVFLEPAPMRVTLKMNQFTELEAKVSGSKTQAEYEKYKEPINRLNQRWKVVDDTLSAINKRSN